MDRQLKPIMQIIDYVSQFQNSRSEVQYLITGGVVLNGPGGGAPGIILAWW